MNRISLVLSLEDPPSRWFTTLVGRPSVDGRMSLSWFRKVILLGGSLVVKQICHDTLWFACCRFNDLSMWVVFICFNGNDPTNFGGSLSSLHESWTWQALPMRHHETEELWVGDTKKDHGNHGMHSGDFRLEHWYVGQIQLIPKSSVLSSCSALKPRVQLGNHPCSDQTTSLLPRKVTTLMPDFKDRDVEAQRISQSISSGKIWTYPFFDSPHQRVRIIYWILLIYSWSVFSKRICHLH